MRPDGPDWKRFAVFCPEKDVGTLPDILSEREKCWAGMGQIARAEWEKWYGPDVRFHRMIDDCAKILSDRRIPERLRQFSLSGRLLRLKGRRWKAAVLRNV